MEQELKQVLTQEEVEALQKAISSGQVEAGDGRSERDGTYEIYSFLRYRPSVHLPSLDTINERLGRILRAIFFSRFDLSLTASVGSVEVKPFGEFLGGFNEPTCLVQFTITPPGGPGLLTIEAKQAFYFVDRMCGGSGGQSRGAEKMEFQDIGQSLIKRMALYILQGLQKAWCSVFPVKIEYSGLHFNPVDFEATAPEEFQEAPMNLIPVEIKFEQSISRLYICLARSVLQPLVDLGWQKAVEERSRLEPAWAHRVKEVLTDVSVELAVELGTSTITVRNFLSLLEGSTIQLDKSVVEELMVKVEGAEKLKGFPGKYRGHRAIQVMTLLDKRSAGNGSRGAEPKR